MGAPRPHPTPPSHPKHPEHTPQGTRLTSQSHLVIANLDDVVGHSETWAPVSLMATPGRVILPVSSGWGRRLEPSFFTYFLFSEL